MKQLKELQQIDPTQIKNDGLKQMLVEYLDEYKKAQDPEDFITVTSESADKILSLVKAHFPNAIPNSKKQAPNSKEQSRQLSGPKDKQQATKNKSQNPDPKTQKKKNQPPKSSNQQSKTANQKSKKALSGLQKEIEQCRLKIRKYNEVRRASEPKKPKPTRYDKIKSHLIAIGNLIPEKLKDDLRVQQETRRILLRTHRLIMDNYQMSTLKARKDHDTIKERFTAVEAKLKEKE